MTIYALPQTTITSAPEFARTEGTDSGRVSLDAFEHSPQLAELRVSYQCQKPTQERPAIRNAQDAEQYLRQIWNLDTIELLEDLVVLCLNGNHGVIGWVKVSSGGLDSTTVDPRIVFGIALQTASSSIIIAHNHPSGSMTPSKEDRAITSRLKEGGGLLGIRVLDHLILTRDGCYSFAEHGDRI